MKPKRFQYSARVTDMCFIDKETASWLAIKSLVTAEGRKINFDDLYTGLLADHFIAWMRSNFDQFSETKKSELLQHALSFERPRMYARDITTKYHDIYAQDIAPLGRAISLIWRDGISKKDAFEEVSEFASFLRRHNDPDNLKKWPKPMLDISVRTLERKWRQYQLVLPHIMLIYLKERAEQSGCHPPLAIDLPVTGKTLRAKLLDGAKTRRPDLKPWLVLTLK